MKHTKHSKITPDQIRTILSNLVYQYIAFILIADLIYMGTGPRSVATATQAIALSAYILWSLRSILKYGFIDTLEMQGTLPFALLSIALSHLGMASSSTPVDDKTLIAENSTPIADAILEQVTVSHSGKIDRIDMKDSGFYVYIKIPFGIHPPFEKIVETIAHDFHFSKDSIDLTRMNATNVYIFIPVSALRESRAFQTEQTPHMDLSTLKEKLLLRTPSA